MKKNRLRFHFHLVSSVFLMVVFHIPPAHSADTDAPPPVTDALSVITDLLLSQPTKLGRHLQEDGHPQDIDDFNALTWNMQGATANGENKWLQVANMMRDNQLDIVALQETGAPPQSAVQYLNYGTVLQTTFNRGTGQNTTYRVNHYGWLPHGSNGDLYQIFHLPVDADNPGLRTNIAIVTRFEPSHIVLVPPARHRNGNRGPRPALGVVIQNSDRPGTATTFYTLHAASNGDNESNDATNMLVSINQWHHSETRPIYPGGDTLAVAGPSNSAIPIPTRSYAVLGDFNRNLMHPRYVPYQEAHCPLDGVENQCTAEDARGLCRASVLDPSVLQRVALLHPGAETQRNGGELDYAVAAHFDTRTPWFVRAVATILTAVGYSFSDHRPVLFKRNCNP